MNQDVTKKENEREFKEMYTEKMDENNDMEKRYWSDDPRPRVNVGEYGNPSWLSDDYQSDRREPGNDEYTNAILNLSQEELGQLKELVRRSDSRQQRNVKYSGEK